MNGGGDWGSNAINSLIRRELRIMFGPERMNALEADRIDGPLMLQSIEEAKCTSSGDAGARIQISEILKYGPRGCKDGQNAESLVAQYNAANNCRVKLQGMTLLFPAAVFEEIIMTVVNSTVNHLREVVDREGDPVRAILLAGNFANSAILKKAVKEAFETSTRKVVIPANPGGAVMKGATLWCNHARWIEGKKYCSDYFDLLVSKFDEIPHGHIVERDYVKLEAAQRRITVLLWSFDDPVKDAPPPKLVDSTLMTLVGSVTIDVSQSKKGSIVCGTTFGGSNIQIRCVNEDGDIVENSFDLV
ncbi:Heat shock 70 kDa protein 12A [Thoreauomyces humboldtii]|nr:Heat shock 70 kDa protein 12A [Thoreauomyces humboldtii]